MPVYSYQALDQDGQVVEGVIDADTESTVIANLRGQGRRPLSVSLGESTGKSEGFSLPDLASLLGRDKVRTHDLALFTRELATLLRAGMPLDRSLHSLAGLSESERGAVIAQAQTMLDPWRDGDLIRMPGTAHLAVATKPGNKGREAA